MIKSHSHLVKNMLILSKKVKDLSWKVIHKEIEEEKRSKLMNMKGPLLNL